MSVSASIDSSSDYFLLRKVAAFHDYLIPFKNPV